MTPHDLRTASSFTLAALLLLTGGCAGDSAASDSEATATEGTTVGTDTSTTTATTAGTDTDDPSGGTDSEGVTSSGGATTTSGESTTDVDPTAATDTTTGDPTTTTSAADTTDTASTTSATDTDATDTDATDTDTDTDTGVEPPPLAEWVLAIEDMPGNAIHRLLKISVAEGEVGQVTVICPNLTVDPSIGQVTNFTSLTFNQAKLYASAGKGGTNANTLVLVDPCNCNAAEVGQYGQGIHSVAGITSNTKAEMLGISGSINSVIKIDVNTAAAAVLAMLSMTWGTHGLTWSDADSNLLYGINGANDRLYTFEASTGVELDSIALSRDFGSVGLEYHPGLSTLYACSNPGDLWSVDIMTGLVTTEATLGLNNCDNLAAPFGLVECIPQ
ncbi:MAG: hypothetical protein IPK80_13100 [Nannocystis sp.]|nr:hypothetical protein [Nannocystis sp.]